MRGYVLLGVLLLSTFISFSQGGWCTSTSLSVDDCSNGTTSSSHSATEFNSSCSGSETSEGFFWLPGAVEGETYDFTTVSPTLASLGISVFGVDGLSCTASTVNEITCSTSAIGVNSVTATLSGSQYYYIQVYTTDGSSGSDYVVCMSSTSSSGGGGSGGSGGCVHRGF